MTGDGKDLLRIEHSSLPAQHIFDLPVIQARDPAGYDQQRFIAGQIVLAICAGSTPCTFGRKLNSRRAVVSLDEFDVRRVRSKERGNRFKAHWLLRPHSTGFAPLTGR
jgi:hypothetical protein